MAVCLAGLFFLFYNRHNKLHSDPDALATKMSLVGQSLQLLTEFEGAENCPDIRKCIRRGQCKLWLRGEEDGHRLDIVGADDAITSKGLKDLLQNHMTAEGSGLVG